MAGEDAGVSRSPWMRSCERKRLEGACTSKPNRLGVKMQERILFKQAKVIQQADERMNEVLSLLVACHVVYPQGLISVQTLWASYVKLVTISPLRGGHFEQLKRTPFWIMIEAIRINKLNHNDFRKFDEAILKIIRTHDKYCDAFNIGRDLVKLYRSDIRLLFGIQCGTRHLDLSPCQRPTSDFIQWRSNNTIRITSKLVKTLFKEAVCRQNRLDEEDAAKLLTLYVCGKLFFTNSGETIS